MISYDAEMGMAPGNGRKDLLVAMAEKKSTSRHIAYMTVDLNFFTVQWVKRGFSATILRGGGSILTGQSEPIY